ncbi:hypothetical protein MRX96_039295, partial [Rhipicephalus microplus]
SFTLICVFEYLENIIPRNTPQCTDYVYIRFFVYSYRVNQEPMVFEHKKRMGPVYGMATCSAEHFVPPCGITSARRLTMSDFNGFAVINTIIQDTRILGRAKSFGEAFRAASEPILEPDWVYLHTAAIWPGSKAGVPESMVVDVLR